MGVKIGKLENELYELKASRAKDSRELDRLREESTRLKREVQSLQDANDQLDQNQQYLRDAQEKEINRLGSVLTERLAAKDNEINHLRNQMGLPLTRITLP